MVDAIEKVLRRYGSSMTLVHSGMQIPFSGFLQHFRSKSWQNMQREFGPLGQIPRGQYVLIAPMEPEIDEGDTITQGRFQVVVRRIETVTVGDRAAYRWGLCVKKDGGQRG